MGDFTNKRAAANARIRTPRVQVLLDLWDWQAGSKRETVDVTQSVLQFTFSKTLKTPMGGCTMSLTPIVLDENDRPRHVLDMVSTMDVVVIKEFGTVKFQGYVRRIGTNGVMDGSGKPSRTVTLTVTHIGGLLYEAQLGYQIIGARLKDVDEQLGGYVGAAQNLQRRLANLMEDGGVLIKDIVSTLKDEWFNLLAALNATTYQQFLETYIDFDAGMRGFTKTRVIPTDLYFFYGSLDKQTFWKEIQKLAEVPFNEFFFDEGGHRIKVEETEFRLPEDKTCLIGRPTPFNGTWRSGEQFDYFEELPLKEIPLRYMTRYDFGASTEESYSVYMAVPSYSDFNEYTLYVAGKALVDQAMLNKYLLRPLTMSTFYATAAKKTSTGPVNNYNDFTTEMENATKTLKAWYEKNDQYLSGNITIMVPEETEEDIHLGDKVSLEGLDGHFYVEGVAHSWSYGGALSSSLSVTRGYNYDENKAIEFNDRIFTAGGFPGGRVKIV